MRKIHLIFILILVLFLILIFIFFPFGEKNEAKLLQRNEINNLQDKDAYFPERNRGILEPELGERAGIAILFVPKKSITGETIGDFDEKILYQKNIDEKLSIASLTKIMSAIIAMDNYSLDKKAKVSKEAVEVETDIGRIAIDEELSISDIIELSLLVSSNDAAAALSEVIGNDKFVNLMNKKAKEIQIQNTYFINPHGLDEKDHKNNLSTAYEMAKLSNYSVLNYPKIWEILRTKEKHIFGKDNLGREIDHYLRNSLLLHFDGKSLLDDQSFLGGKTGYTDDALDTIILAAKNPANKEGNLIIVLLGVDIGERVSKGKILYDWVRDAYQWDKITDN